MGRFEDRLRARMVERRLKDRYKWPAGFKGMIMWCPLCTKEITRVPHGEQLDAAGQKLVVDAHNQVCGRQRLKLVDGGS